MTAPRRTAARLLVVLGAAGLVLGVSGTVVPAEAGRSHYRLTRAATPGVDPVVRWNPCQAVTYAVNLRHAGSSPAARRSAHRDVHGAVARLSRATGIRFVDVGSTRQIPRNSGGTRWWDRQQRAEVVIAWVRQSRPASRSDLLGRTGDGWVAGTGGYVYKAYKLPHVSRHVAPIGRGFVVLDAAQRHLFRPGFGGGATRGALLMHELAHVMGLQHVSATSEIMYPTILRRTSTEYRSGDRNGLSRVGRPAGCIQVPPSVWGQL